MDKDKLRALQAMAGPRESVSPKVPLRDPQTGEPIDAETYWIQVKYPNNADADAVAAEQEREYTEEIVELDRDDPSKNKIIRRSYKDPRVLPLLSVAFDLDLVVAGQVPAWGDDGELTIHKFTGNGREDWAWLAEQKSHPLFRALYFMVIVGLFGRAQSEVVAEGEASAEKSAGSQEDQSL